MLRMLSRTSPLLSRSLNASTLRTFPRPLNPAKLRTFSRSHPLNEIRYVRFGNPPPRPGGDPRGKTGRNLFLELTPALKLLTVLGVGGGVYVVTHLEQVPDTGRWRFMHATASDEAKMGELVKQEIEKTMGNAILPPNHVITRHVRRVVSRILTASNLGTLRGERQPEDVNLFGVVGGNFPGGFGGFSTPDSDFGAATRPNEAYGPEKEWDVIVVNDKKMVNAMAAPGVVVVFTGILPICKDEEGLAAVLGHEIGHVVARHPAERMSSQYVLYAVVLGLQLLGIDYFVSQGISTYLLDLPNSRTQEREADLIGLRLMSRACYDPGAAPAMFERLGKVEAAASAQGFEFTRTHPRSEKRAKILQHNLPEAYRILEDNPECSQVRRQLEGFRESVRGIEVDERGGIRLI
ncbi:peptidase M48 family protein [Coprinopsis sp. MPI-PUGE-AT-0042]|nr:peptidase M48 family protein [Coprinopsis sp. MPI-PUGE-AT-0042]